MKKKLSELGYRFSGEELHDIDALTFVIIAGELSRLESESARKKSQKMRSRRG